jgi:hypothetical protein
MRPILVSNTEGLPSISPVFQFLSLKDPTDAYEQELAAVP